VVAACCFPDTNEPYTCFLWNLQGICCVLVAGGGVSVLLTLVRGTRIGGEWGNSDELRYLFFCFEGHS